MLRCVVPHHGPQLVKVEVRLVGRSGQQMLNVLSVLVVAAIADNNRLLHSVELDHAPASETRKSSVEAQECDV